MGTASTWRFPFPRTVGGTLAALLAFVLLAELVREVLVVRSTVQEARERALRSSAEAAVAAAGTLRAHLADIVHEQLELGDHLVRGGELDAAATHFAQSAEEYPAVRSFALLDAQGRPVGSGAPHAPELGGELRRERWFAALVHGSAWSLSDLVLSPDGQQASFVVATAIRTGGGQLAAVVVAVVDPRRLQPLFAARSGQGSIALIDGRGQLVARLPDLPLSRTQRDLAPALRTLGPPGERKAAGTIRSPVDGRKKLVAVTRIGELPWYALASQTEQEVVQPVMHAAAREAGLAAGAMILAVGLAWLLARRVTGPLRTLRAHAVELGAGKLSHRVELEGPAELEALASTFNVMTERLADREHRLVESSERARAAAERADRDAAQLRLLLASLPEGVVVADAPDGRVMAANPAAVALLGREVPAGTSLDTMAGHFGLARPDGTPYAPADLPISRALRGEQVVRQEVTIHRPDGTGVTVMVNSAPLKRDGRIERAIAVFQDVTALKEVEQLREDFVRLVSHDLRNPLHVVQMSLQLLERSGAASDERAQRAVGAIRTAVFRMTGMVDDLLESGRVESGTLELDLRPLELPGLVHAHLESLGEERARVRVSTQGEVLGVRADGARLERVIANLVSNALKYSQDEVVVTIAGGPGEVQVRVADRGIGVPPEVAPQLFQRFYRAPGARGVEGLGLGLYITRPPRRPPAPGTRSAAGSATPWAASGRRTPAPRGSPRGRSP